MANEPLKPLQERLKQEGTRLAEAAVARAQRGVVGLLTAVGAELGQKLDGIFDGLLSELNSDQRGSDESGTGRFGQR